MTDLLGPAAIVPARCSIDDVLRVLRSVRVREAGLQEVDIRDRLLDHLLRAGLPAIKEHVFAKGCRADIWIDGIVIEVKKKRPHAGDLLAQLQRYAAATPSRAVVLVLERAVPVPDAIDDKPVVMLSLNSLWGVAL